MGKRNVVRGEAGEVSSGQTVTDLESHVIQFGLYPENNGEALKRFK